MEWYWRGLVSAALAMILLQRPGWHEVVMVVLLLVVAVVCLAEGCVRRW
jgi:hypothetical protein